MNDAHPRSAPKAKLSRRIARMVQRREDYDLIGNDSDAAPPSPPSPKPKPLKRIKKNCIGGQTPPKPAKPSEPELVPKW